MSESSTSFLLSNNSRSIPIIRSPFTQAQCYVTFVYRRNRGPIIPSDFQSGLVSDPINFAIPLELRLKRTSSDHGTESPATLVWVDFHGRLVSYGSMLPGSTKTIDSFAGHVWLAYDSVHGDFFQMSALSATSHFDGLLVGSQPRRIFPLPRPLENTRGGSTGDRLVVLIHLPCTFKFRF